MKNRILITFFVALLGGLTQTFAQNVKIGYTNLEYILAQLPESKQVETQLKEFEKQLQTSLQSKYNEYEQKLAAYREGSATMAPIVKEDKEKELMNLQNSIREFEEKAQNEMQKKQVELLEPVLNKVQKSIDKVAEANGFSYVLSTHTDMGGSAIILYAKNKEDNISDLVLKDLGVTPAPQADTKAPAATEPKPATPATTAPVKKK
jgi:outer membrane protein